MVRVIVGMTAWLGGTALAVTVAWLGAHAVMANAGMSPGTPVVVTAPTSPPAAAPARATPPATPRAPATTQAPAATQAPSRTSARTPGAPTGTTRGYTLAGGRVTLDVTATSVTLVSAVPDAGYAVQTWSGTGWLRVDFSSGPRVSSLIASWYQHAPSVTVTN